MMGTQPANCEMGNALHWKSVFPETLLATSDTCTVRRPVWSISEIPPTSLSAWSECPSFPSLEWTFLS